jgi:hypothetical protein
MSGHPNLYAGALCGLWTQKGFCPFASESHSDRVTAVYTKCTRSACEVQRSANAGGLNPGQHRCMYGRPGGPAGFLVYREWTAPARSAAVASSGQSVTGFRKAGGA